MTQWCFWAIDDKLDFKVFGPYNSPGAAQIERDELENEKQFLTGMIITMTAEVADLLGVPRSCS